MKEIGSGKLSALKRAGKEMLTLSFALDGGGELALSVPASLYERMGSPAVGAAFSEQTLQDLFREAEYLAGCRHALRILEAGDNNSRTLFYKLVKKGIRREIADEVVERMVARGYIREAEQARRLAVGYARRNLWGPRKIVATLLSHGYARKDAEAAVADASDGGEIDFAEVRETLIKRCRARGLAPEKIRSALWRYGFGDEE